MTAAADTPQRIIVADDDAGIRQVLAKLLAKSGYEAEVASSGAEAIQLASAKAPDLFILDVRMPQLDGYETCRQLKADPRFAQIPVIFLSGKSEPDARVAGLDLGAVDYVAKPFNAHELMARVRATLRTSRHARVAQLGVLHEELDLAGKIQQSLLPRQGPRIKALDVYGEMLPMRRVGGDYFDFVEGAEGLIVCVGDVSGKGIPAALVMVMARTFLNHWDVNLSDTRMSLLALNRLLYDNTDAGIFMSMVLLKWDPDAHRMTYTGAGHEHLLIYRAATGQLERLLTGGQVLGLRVNIIDSLEERQLELSDGDALLLYTDGITEALSPSSEEYGLERLERAFHASATGTAEDIVEHVFGDISAFTAGHKQVDDITLVAIKRNDALQGEDR